MASTRKTETKLQPSNKTSTLATQVKVNFLAEKMVKSGWTRYDVLKYVQDEWKLSKAQAERYYASACSIMLPPDEEKWRDYLFSRNLSTLEELLKMSVERNDIKSAVDVVKTMNQMLGIGGKAVKIDEMGSEGQQRRIVISFGE